MEQVWGMKWGLGKRIRGWGEYEMGAGRGNHGWGGDEIGACGLSD